MSILAVLCIMFVFVTIFKKKRAGEFTRRPTEVFKERRDSAITADRKGPSSRQDINRYSSLWRARIDGSRSRDPNELVEESTKFVPGNETIGEILEVTGIVNSAKAPVESKARLKYLKEINDEKVLWRELWSQEGDSLKVPYSDPPYSGKVVKIEESKVTFTWFGEEVSLKPNEFKSAGSEDLEEGSEDSPIARDPTERYRRKPPSETEEYEPGHYALSRKEYKEINENYEAILRNVSIASYTNPETGKKSVKLSSVDKKSLVYKRGFRSQDVLISINGIPCSTKSAAVNYFKQHPNEGKYVIEIERMGRRVFKTFYYDDTQ